MERIKEDRPITIKDDKGNLNRCIADVVSVRALCACAKPQQGSPGMDHPIPGPCGTCPAFPPSSPLAAGIGAGGGAHVTLQLRWSRGGVGQPQAPLCRGTRVLGV